MSAGELLGTGREDMKNLLRSEKLKLRIKWRDTDINCSRES